MYHSRVVVLFFLAVTLTAAPVLAQEPSGSLPALEIGLDAAIAAPDVISEQARVILAPRVVTNLSRRTALHVSGDALARRDYFGDSWADTRVFTAEMHRHLWQTERFSLSGIVGGGVGRSQFYQPPYRYQGGGEIVTVPAYTYTSTGGEFTLGVGARQLIAPRLVLRQEAKVVLGEVSEFRAQLGVSVPIGKFPPRFEPLRARSGGRPDSLRNGTGIGAVVGAAVMTGFVAFLANALCEGDCENLGAAVAVGALYGGGAGALTGAMVDSFIE
jgi:hypothetical protein